MARNSLSEEEALKRIRAQMSNTDRIARAHVVLSNNKDLDATKAQAQLAWAGVRVSACLACLSARVCVSACLAFLSTSSAVGLSVCLSVCVGG